MIKKTFVLLILFHLVISIYSQQLKFEGGLGYTTQFTELRGTDQTDNYFLKLNYEIGLTREFILSNLSSIKTGLSFDVKGWNQKDEIIKPSFSTDYNRTLNIWYINLPLTFKQEFRLLNNIFYGELGIYGAYALFGNYTFGEYENGQVEIKRSKLGFAEEDTYGITRYDWGLNGSASTKFNKIEIGLKYKYGILDITLEEKREVKNRTLILFIAFPFVNN